MGGALSTNAFPVEGRTVLITGASRGMGLEAGRQLAAKGANVVLAARDEKRLLEGTEYMRAAAMSESQRFHHLSVDLTSYEEAQRMINEVTKWNLGSPPDVVWCCAGASHPTLFVDTDVSAFRSQMDSNYFSAVYTSHAALRSWLRPGAEQPRRPEASAKRPAARHLILTGSFLAFYPIAGYAPYSPTRAAIRALSDELSQEMELYAAANPDSAAVKVHTVFPATILTESYEAENKIKSDLTKMLEGPNGGQTAEEVARGAIRGLESGQELITTDWQTRLVMCSILGGSGRGGFWKGLLDGILGSIMLLVMVFIRGDMDRQVRSWGRMYGDSGMKKVRAD
ncbi:hypothetical protein N0V82_003273 [Gnomoniopsis sp. IMI 355080]|nr:hypothetical protein N0V82_003273 [Gnomoniopsis sp. IMI 355080]